MINKNRIKNQLLMVMVLALAFAYGCKKDSPDLKSISPTKPPCRFIMMKTTPSRYLISRQI